jgi:hypothetical protein
MLLQGSRASYETPTSLLRGAGTNDKFRSEHSLLAPVHVTADLVQQQVHSLNAQLGAGHTTRL